jgi:DNA-nicking Smr family endonuclease
MRRPRRDLSDDELALWRYVTRNVTPQAGRGVVSAARHPAPEPDVEIPAAPPRVRTAPVVSAPPLVAGTTAGIDRRTAQRFTRGQMAIDARLDLHGMTLREAHAAVGRFLRLSATAGYRCVLVITGKGGGEAPGRIRGEIGHWLSQTALRPLILAVHQARTRHGGAGALYILLKRQRSGPGGR